MVSKKQMKLKALGFLSLVVSLPALAASGGTDVSESDYNDSLVHIVVNDSTFCGGTLINGNWILTAKHCTPLYFDSDDNEGTVKVYQGTKTLSNLVYDGDAVFYSDIDDNDVLEDAEAYYEDNVEEKLTSIEYSYSKGSESGTPGLYYQTKSMTNDIALINISSSIAYKSTAELVKFDNYSSDEVPESLAAENSIQNYQIGTSFTYRGWGKTSDEEDFPETMQEINLILKDSVVNVECSYWFTYDDESSISQDCGDTSLESDESVKYGISYTRVKVAGSVVMSGENSEEGAQSGDSGTGLFDDDGALVGLIYEVYSDSEGYSNNIVTFDFYLDWIASKVSSLNAPKLLELSESSSGTYAPDFTYKIQNLSLSVAPIAPYIDNTEFFYISEDNCPSTLDVGESCELSISSNSKYFEKDDSETANLVVNDEFTAALVFSIGDSDSSDSDSSDSSSSSSSGSSGGSGSPYLIVFMLIVMANRVLKRRS